MTDELNYEVKLFELENGRWNYYVYGRYRMAQGWSQGLKVGNGSADTETQAIQEAQEKATRDRQERKDRESSTKIVALQ